MPLLLHMVDVLIYTSPDNSLSLMVAPFPDKTWHLCGAIDNPSDPEGEALSPFASLFFADRDTALRVGSEYAIRHEGGTLENVKARTLEWEMVQMPLDVEFINIPSASLYADAIPMRGYVN